MLYHWATRESWFTKFSFLYYYICIICHMVLHVHVHPLNCAFDSSKINGYAFTCTLLKMHFYVKDQQIDANKLQGYLSSSGFFESCYRKYDFMYFMHWFGLIIFISVEPCPHTSRYWQKCGQVCSFLNQAKKWEK